MESDSFFQVRNKAMKELHEINRRLAAARHGTQIRRNQEEMDNRMEGLEKAKLEGEKAREIQNTEKQKQIARAGSR